MRRKSIEGDLEKIIAEYERRRQRKLFSNRPLRDKVIKREDIINLKIALNSSKTLEEFLKQV
jgi:hypothetical protein